MTHIKQSIEKRVKRDGFAYIGAAYGVCISSLVFSILSSL